MELREALTELKGPLSQNAEFRKRLQKLLNDEKERGSILDEIGLGSTNPLGVGCPERTTQNAYCIYSLCVNGGVVAQDSALSAAQSAAQVHTTEHAVPAVSMLDQIIDQTQAAKVDAAKPLMQKGSAHCCADPCRPKRAARRARRPRSIGPLSIARLRLLIRSSASRSTRCCTTKVPAAESGWRGLKFMVERTDFRQNIRVSLLNVSKQDLYDDFQDAPELFQSGLYQHVHKAEYGQFGGKPYGAIIGNYDFGPGETDIELLKWTAGVAAMAHAPFIAAAGAEFFGLKSFEGLPASGRAQHVREQAVHLVAQPAGLEDARYIGLTCPRFLLRRPYGADNPVKSFNYTEESGQHNQFLWGNTAFAFATRLTESFARYRWCPNIIGPTGRRYRRESAGPSLQVGWRPGAKDSDRSLAA